MKTEVPTVCEEPRRENKSFQLSAIKNRQKSLPESTKSITKGNRLLSPTVWRGLGRWGNSNETILRSYFLCIKLRKSQRKLLPESVISAEMFPAESRVQILIFPLWVKRSLTWAKQTLLKQQNATERHQDLRSDASLSWLNESPSWKQASC